MSKLTEEVIRRAVISDFMEGYGTTRLGKMYALSQLEIEEIIRQAIIETEKEYGI